MDADRGGPRPATGPRRSSRSRRGIGLRGGRRPRAAAARARGRRAPLPRHALGRRRRARHGTAPRGSTASASGDARGSSTSDREPRSRAAAAPSAQPARSLAHAVGRCRRHASSRLERRCWPSSSSTRATTCPRRAARRPAEPDARAGRDRAPLPRLREAGLRRLAADGAPLLRAHGRRGHHRPDPRRLRALRRRERRHAGPRLARRAAATLRSRRERRLAVTRTILRGALHLCRVRVAEEAERPDLARA